MWKSSEKTQAVGKSTSLAGGLLTIAGGIATVITGGAAAPLLIAGMSCGVAGAGINLTTSYIEASRNSSEIEEAEEKLRDIRDSMENVKNTIQLWWKTKDVVRLLYIYCLAELNQDKNDPVKTILHKLVLHPLECTAVNVGKPRSWEGRNADSSFAAGAWSRCRASAAERVAMKLGMAFSAVFPLVGAIDLAFIIKDIVEDKGSTAARFLREKADELERVFSSGFLM